MKVIQLAACIVVPLAFVGCNTTECKVDNPNKGIPLATGPSIEEINVRNTTHGAPAKVEAVLRLTSLSGLHKDGASVHVRSTRVEGDSFGPTLPMHESSNLSYARQLYPLNYGPYEACVMADFRPQPSLEPELPITRTFVDKVEFFVGPGEPCELWNDEAAGTAGWTFGGLRDVATGQHVPTPGHEPYFGRTTYGLTVLTGALTPVQGLQAAADLWSFDFISPDLTNDPAWQGLPEIVFQVSVNTDITAWAQPVFSYLYDDGSNHHFAPIDDAGEWIFYELNGTDTFYAPTQRPGNAVLNELRIRIFGAYGITTPEFFVHLKMLCPMPARLPNLLGPYTGEILIAAGAGAPVAPAKKTR